MVTAVSDTFNLLGLSPDADENGELKTTWDQMKSSLEANNETFAWMNKVEDDILDAAHQRNLRNPETSFRALMGNSTARCWPARSSMAEGRENSR